VKAVSPLKFESTKGSVDHTHVCATLVSLLTPD